MRRTARWLLSGLFAVLFTMLTTAGAWAQATAQVSGVVKDQTGAVLPGAEGRQFSGAL